MVIDGFKRAAASVAIRDDSLSWAENIPTKCYSQCNDMVLERQSGGIGENCSSTEFLPDLRKCYNCAKGMKNETSFANYIQEMIDECVLGEPITATQTFASTTQTSMTHTSATQTPTTRTTSSAQSSEHNPSQGHSNISAIVPAVVVPVLVLGIAVTLFLIFRRRRQRKRFLSASSIPPFREHKAQLHADDFRPELDGSSSDGKNSAIVHEMPVGPVVSHDHKVELPAGEVAEEMEAKRENKYNRSIRLVESYEQSQYMIAF